MIRSSQQLKFLIIAAWLLASFFLADSGLAAGVMTDQQAGNTFSQTEALRLKAGFQPPQALGAADIVALVIKGFLGLLGIIFIILIIIAGYNWLTAAGDEDKVTKAKNTLARAIIGLIIIISAYAITAFVFRNLPGTGPGGGGGGAGPGFTSP